MERLGLNRKLIQRKRTRLDRFWICVVFALIPIVLFEGFTLIVQPSLMELCQIKATSIGVSVSNDAVKQVMNDTKYEDLIELERDNSGKIIALKANVIGMNQISSKIGLKIQELYNQINEAYVTIPLGNFTGNALLAGRGPNIKVRIIPVGTVSTDFKTEFISSGINQTRHRVYLEIVSSVRVVAPLTTKTIQVTNNVNVAETVLVGDVPNSFYNLEGVNDLTTDDSLNMWDE